ncbi:hypothetical protein D4Q76_01920 [archaeon]|nr:MAG: hypothetical protein D4Q76_01920 [archaeon]
MSDFLPVLTVGIILLAIMFLFFGGFQFGPAAPRAHGIGFEEEAPLPPPVSGTVGFPQEAIRTITVANDFSVSFESGGKSVAALRNSSVENGVFGKIDREVSFDAQNQQDILSARIKMNITGTNLYGFLVASLNGADIFNNYSLIGRLDIPINASALKPTNNNLKIESTGSGWKIWAPAVYYFDADVLINYYSLKAKSFEFVADGGIKSITSARFVAVVSKKEGSGNLIARINGKEIYRGNNSRLAVADFSASDVSLGAANTLELMTEKGAKYDITSAEILLYYQPIYKTQSLYYNLTSDQYSSFANATLGFGIQKISGEVVSILVKTTDGAGGVHSIIPQGILREGNSYNITLTRNELYAGSNKIEFVTSGTGYVNIENATIM